MKNLEFFRNISIGLYVDKNTFVHALSPVTKFLWLFAFMIPVNLSRSLSLVAVLTGLLLAVALCARIKVGFLLRGILPVFWLIVFASFMQVLFTWPSDTSRVLLSLGDFSITVKELLQAALMVLRFFAMMIALGLFTSVTTEGDTARGIESLASPLSRIGFPAHEFALTIAVAFRFIPIIAGELEAIVKAQASRGANFGGRGFNPIAKVVAYIPLLVPVTIRALERANALADAMEARCYSSAVRSRYIVEGTGAMDALLSVAALGFGAAATILGFVSL